jgi:hypothetical protein
MEMELSWAASEPGFVHLPVERRSGAEYYIARIEELLTRGEGFTEVSCNSQPYPRVSFAFRTAYGVVEHWSSSEHIFLMLGDGIISNDETISVPEYEGDAQYTGAFVSSRQHAWDAVKKFIESGSVDEIGQWVEL